MFKWMRRKASRALGLLLSPYSGAVWPKRNVRRLIMEGYERNVIVFRCIEEVSKAVASVPVEVYREDEPANIPELTTLLQRPNYQTSLSMLVRELITDLLTTGDLYIERVRPGERRPPTELWPLRPMYMRPIVNGGRITGYEYSVNGNKTTWEVDTVTGKSDILHLRTANPLDSMHGLPPIQVAAANIDQHNEGDLWNYSLLKNGAALSGILYTEGQLDDQQFANVQQMLKETWGGGRNAGGIPVLEGGLKFQETMMRPSDMAWLDNKDMTARFICQAFGVPPHLLGLAQGSTFNNVQEARIYFWDTTVVPMAKWLWEEVGNWLAQDWEGISIVPDFDQVPALESRREQRWERLQKAEFLTINEKREALGYPPVEGGDVLYMPATMIPVGSEPEDAEEAAKDLDLSPEEYERWLREQGVAPLRAKSLTKLAYGEE